MTPCTRVHALRDLAITMMLLIAAIHAHLLYAHLQEKFYVGVLFGIGSLAFGAAALALLIPRARPAGWALGMIVALGMFGGYLASRTVGLPLGYHEEFGASIENLLGYVSLWAEAVVVMSAFAVARLRLGGRVRQPVAPYPATAASRPAEARAERLMRRP